MSLTSLNSIFSDCETNRDRYYWRHNKSYEDCKLGGGTYYTHVASNGRNSYCYNVSDGDSGEEHRRVVMLHGGICHGPDRLVY